MAFTDSQDSNTDNVKAIGIYYAPGAERNWCGQVRFGRGTDPVGEYTQVFEAIHQVRMLRTATGPGVKMKAEEAVVLAKHSLPMRLWPLLRGPGSSLNSTCLCPAPMRTLRLSD